MNKTQNELISRLVNRFNTGGYKLGWTLTVTKDSIFLSLQKLNEINQAFKLEEKYPELFRTDTKSFRLVNLYLLDDCGARKLLTN